MTSGLSWGEGDGGGEDVRLIFMASGGRKWRHKKYDDEIDLSLLGLVVVWKTMPEVSGGGRRLFLRRSAEEVGV